MSGPSHPGPTAGPAAAPVRCEELTGIAEILELAPEWDALLERSPCNRAFSSPEWFLASCRLAGASPLVLTAKRGETLCGLLALLVERDGALATPARLTDCCDLVAPAADLPVLAALLARATSPRRGCRRLLLRRLRSDSNALRALRACGQPAVAGRSESYPCFYSPLPATAEEYMAGRSRKLRKNLRHAWNEAGLAGIVLRPLTPETFPPEELPRAFLALHGRRFGAESCLDSPGAPEFLEEVLPPLFVRRRVLAWALFRGTEMAGINLFMLGAGSLCDWNGGFLPELAGCSPGSLLIQAGIGQACALGLREYDFLRGDEGYKARWAACRREIQDLEIPLEGR